MQEGDKQAVPVLEGRDISVSEFPLRSLLSFSLVSQSDSERSNPLIRSSFSLPRHGRPFEIVLLFGHVGELTLLDLCRRLL